MEIVKVDSYTLRVPIGREVGDSRLSITDCYWIVVEIETRDGTRGTGWMGSLGFAPDILSDFVESQFRDMLIGRDPFETKAISEDLRRQTIYYGELGLSAWPRSTIDVALWDIKAKVANQPLYRFLGGDQSRVRAYASSMDARHDTDQLINLHGEYLADGFSAFKTKVGNRSPEEEAKRVAAVRNGIGEEAELFIDANQAWTLKETVEMLEQLAPHNIGWIEEPIREFDEAAHGRLANRLETKLATGEMFYRLERFRRFLELGGVDIVQPDLIRSGGITGQLKVAELAEQFGVPVASHFYYAISSHVIAAVSNGYIVEYIPEYDIAPLLEEPPEIKDGHVVLPDEPGHGYHIKSDAKEQFRADLS